MQLPKEARKSYERYLENLRYEASTLGLERKLGKIEGREEGKIETAKVLKAKGVPIDIIAESTGLSEEKIKSL